MFCDRRLFFFPLGVFDEILKLIESVSEGFPSYLCLVINPIKVASFAYLFNCTTVGRASDWMTVPS